LLIGLVLVASASACTTIKSGTIGSGGVTSLNGSWELTYISGPRIAFNGLYPGKKPLMNFDTGQKKVMGHSSCNSFSGQMAVDDTTINLSGPMVSTKMACPGEGEMIFFEMLKKVNTYSITGDTTLNLMTGDIPVMKFRKTTSQQLSGN